MSPAEPPGGVVHYTFAYPYFTSLLSNCFLKLFTWFNASNASLRPLIISRVKELSVINNKYCDRMSICTSLVIKIRCSSYSLLERATWHHGGPVFEVYSKPMCSPGLLDFLSVFVEIVTRCLLNFMLCYDRLLQVISVFLKIVLLFILNSLFPSKVGKRSSSTSSRTHRETTFLWKIFPKPWESQPQQKQDKGRW